MKKGMKTMEKFGKILLVLMFSFSQLSFPIEVLADELSQASETTMEMKDEEEKVQNNEEDNQEEKGVEEENNHTVTPTLNQSENDEENVDDSEKTIQLTINGIAADEYDLMSNDPDKMIRISYGYENEMTTEEIDFSNKLYGDYEFEYTINSTEEVVKVTIHYIGNNDEILSKYLLNDISLEEGKFVILGSFDGIKKTDFLNRIDWKKLMNEYNVSGYSTSIEEGISIVADGEKLIIQTDQFDISYPIQVVGDYNQDGVVDVHDSLFIIDNILTPENEKNYNILDATNPVFFNGKWENNIVAHDDLQNSFVNKTEIPVGEELVVKYYITGFQEDKLTGIEGNINYNKEILELMNVDVSTDFYGTVLENGHFAYLLSNYSSEGIFMTLTFKTLKSGDANISIDNILASLGVKANLDDSVSTTVTVFENGKGGDVDPENTVTPVQTKTEEPVVTPTPVVLTNTTNVTARTIKLSSDNLIKSLTIKGYDIKFDPNTLEYSLKVKNSVKSLDLKVVLNSSSASYEISGNQNFKVGANTVTIKVTAEDGTERTYTLKVTREKAKTEEEQEEKKSSKTIIIILIILVIIGLIYVIFKDDEEDSKESKK